MYLDGAVIKNTYRDSIAMMRVANALSVSDDVNLVEILIGTPSNLKDLQKQGLLIPKIASATQNDIIILVGAPSELRAQETVSKAKENLFRSQVIGAELKYAYSSLETAVRMRPQANLVLISIPGDFVKREAMTAIQNKLNVMIFSDNVSLRDELEIKTAAQATGLLVMGPDCGTAILGGYGLGFANRVSRGNIGIVGASGTGIQEVSCIIHRAGLGISHCIGTGTNDIKQEIGGITFLNGIDILENDPQTEVIVLISKPPDPEVEEKILDRVYKIGKPVVLCFLGETKSIVESRVVRPRTLEETAYAAIRLAGKEPSYNYDFDILVDREVSKFGNRQRFIRGVFSGGTLAIEAALVLREKSLDVSTNLRFQNLPLLLDPFNSAGHTCIDLGDDLFTRGKPHPMLDPLMRRNRIIQEAKDPEVAVLLLDFVLGFGVHPEPVNAILDTLKSAQKIARDEGRHITIAASVTGTDEDLQQRSKQIKLLQENGCLTFESNAQASRFAANLASRLKHSEN